MSSKLAIALGVLVVLVGLTVLTFNAEKAEDARGSSEALSLKTVEKDKVDHLEVAAPGKPKVVLTREGQEWMVAEPVQAPASASAVETALDKLAELEVTGTAATKASNHAVLEVTAEKGIHVIAKNGDAVATDLWIGTYRGGSTMVRQEGAEQVAAVHGSIRYAFDKQVKEWRERSVTDFDVENIAGYRIETPARTIALTREGDEFKLAEGQAPITRFDSAKARSVASSVARLNAVDFAADDVTAESAGTAQGELARVFIQLTSDAGVNEVLLKLGKKVDGNYYLQREGRDEIYTVSSFIGDRLTAGEKEFVKPEESETATAAPGSGNSKVVYPSEIVHRPGPPPGH